MAEPLFLYLLYSILFYCYHRRRGGLFLLPAAEKETGKYETCMHVVLTFSERKPSMLEGEGGFVILTD